MFRVHVVITILTIHLYMYNIDRYTYIYKTHVFIYMTYAYACLRMHLGPRKNRTYFIKLIISINNNKKGKKREINKNCPLEKKKKKKERGVRRGPYPQSNVYFVCGVEQFFDGVVCFRRPFSGGGRGECDGGQRRRWFAARGLQWRRVATVSGRRPWPCALDRAWTIRCR